MDMAYEFDAPRFYNFQRDDDGTSMASRWFDAQDGGLRSPLSEVQQQLSSHDNKQAVSSKKSIDPTPQKPAAPTEAVSKPTGIVGMISNIVTTWGGAAAARVPVNAAKPAAKQQLPSANKPAKHVEPQENRPQSQLSAQSQGSGSARKRWNSSKENTLDPAPAPASTSKLTEQPVAANQQRKQWLPQQPQQLQEQGQASQHHTQAAASPAVTAKPMHVVHPPPKRRSTSAKPCQPAAQAGDAPGKKVSSMRLASQLCKRVAASRRTSHARAAAAAAKLGGELLGRGGTGVGKAAVAAKAKGTVQSAGILKLKKVLMKSLKALPARSTKPLTLPDDVELQTAKRARTHCNADEGPSAQGSPFKPLVLKAQEVFSKTPARFKRKPLPLPPARPLTITQPQVRAMHQQAITMTADSTPIQNMRPTILTREAPELLTDVRSRPPAMLSREERERLEMEAMPKFHALKLNTAALQGSGRVERAVESARPITEPQPFMFVTDDRAERRRKREGGEQDDVAPVFKAQPLDRSILEGPVGLPNRPRRSSTIPKSPLLHTKLRSKELASLGKVDIQKHEFHSRPVPQYLSVPKEFRVPHAEPPAPTQLAPFNLRTERRGKHYQQAMQARMEAEEKAAREARVPRAQLLPLSLDVPIVPPRPEPRGLTLPKPFSLRSEARHQEYVNHLGKEMQEAEAARRAEAEFKARPLPPLDRVFNVHESEAPLTVPQDPHLTTEARAMERAVFDQAVEDKTRLVEEQRRQEEAARQAQEARAVRELRKRLVVHAKPVPDFSRPFMAMPSDRPLTQPVTPKLGRKKGTKRGRE